MVKISSYMHSPLSTSYSIQRLEDRPFPTIYLCLSNMIDKRKLRSRDIHNLQLFFNASRAAGDNRRFLGRINKHYDTDAQEIVGASKNLP